MTKGLLLGRVFGDCKIEKLLGQGGMGAVYQGSHETLRVPVAVKFLVAPGESGGVDRVAAERFMREAQVVAQLRHPNIVRVLNVKSEQGECFMVMELLAGETLGQLLAQRSQLPVEQVKAVGYQVALALAHAHARGVVHRDIKPDNVMITPEGSAVVMDFGIASAAAQSGERLTRQGFIVGTPFYLAPEQARGGQEVDARADVYALGVVLYEALAGALPFAGDDPIHQLMARLTQDPIPLASVRRDVPVELVTLIARMMARAPGDRVQTADEVAQALAPQAPDRTVEPPAPIVATQEIAQAAARTSELTQMAATAGLPFATPPGAHMVELRLADTRAFLRLAEDESKNGAALLLVHRLGEADLVAFEGGRAVTSMKVSRGVPSALPLAELLAAAMRRGEGALVVRAVEPGVVAALRTWIEGQRVLGPLPTEIIRPMGLFARIRRTKTSGVLAVIDRGQATLVTLLDGALKRGGVYAAPVHRPEIATESEGGISVWLESCSPEALITLSIGSQVAASPAAGSASSGPGDEVMRGVLGAVAAATAVLAQEAAKEFGLGSAQVFSKCLRQATAPYRDVVPVAALAGGPGGPVDAGQVWALLAAGAQTGRELAVRLVAEAVLAGAVAAAKEILAEKKLAKAKQAAMTVALKSKPALDALELGEVVQRALG